MKRVVRAMPMPTKDRGDAERKRLGSRRSHTKLWWAPEDAKLILPLHFSVERVKLGFHWAEATLEIPTAKGLEYHHETAGGFTRQQALRRLISQIEHREWFHVFRGKGVRFMVTGEGMDKVYRGYL